MSKADERTSSQTEDVWVAVADLHGHPRHLEALLSYLDKHLEQRYRLVLLGDYVDNGPDIPGLVELLIHLRNTRDERFTAIMGNHDLACLRVLEELCALEEASREAGETGA